MIVSIYNCNLKSSTRYIYTFVSRSNCAFAHGHYVSPCESRTNKTCVSLYSNIKNTIFNRNSI